MNLGVEPFDKDAPHAVDLKRDNPIMRDGIVVPPPIASHWLRKDNVSPQPRTKRLRSNVGDPKNNKDGAFACCGFVSGRSGTDFAWFSVIPPDGMDVFVLIPTRYYSGSK